MNAIFFNDFGRLRSGWRFVIFLFLFLLFTTLLGAAAFVVLSNSPFGFDQQSLGFLFASNLLSFAVAVLAGWLCERFLEGLPFRALGVSFTENWLKFLIWGLALGTFAILLASAIAFVFGGVRFQLNETAGRSAIGLTLATSFLIFIVGAASEEAIFRGYMLQTFSRARLAWFAIALTSLFFACAHWFNPSRTWISLLNTAIAGVLFGAAYLKTRTLWLPFGLHFTWNWIQGAILGIPVSGLKELTTAPLLERIDYGPVWLTGGDYGIEGGIACTVALTVTALIIWFSPALQPSKEMFALTGEEKPLLSKRKQEISA